MSSISIYKNFQNLPQDIQQKLLEFEQTYKSLQDLPNKFVKDTPTFIFKAMLIHKDSYDYYNVDYINAHKKVIITCEKHGDFEQIYSDHLRGSGCPKCFGNSKSNLEEFVEKAKIIHKDSLNKYSYDKFVYKGANIKGVITCEKHGDFQQTPAHHLSGRGCPECSKEKISISNKSNLEEFVEKAKIIHKDKYSYDKFVYKGVHIKGIITCEKHGNFEQSPSNHLSGRGCPECSVDKRSSNLEEFIQKAKIIHKDSLNKYSYDKFVYKGAMIKGTITCPIHGDFQQTTAHHLSGRGCPECWRERNRELSGIKWSDKFDEGILYLIECWNDVERFIKIGVTSKTVEERFRRQRDMPYQYKLLKEIFLDSKSCVEYEQHILDISESYKPKITFGGDSECLSIDEKYYLQDILENLKNDL